MGTERLTVQQYRAMPAAGKRRAAPAPHTPQEPPMYEPQPERPSGARYTFTYSGAGLSSNKWYAGIKWAARIALKKTWAAKLAPLIAAAGFQHMERFTAHLRYRSKMDADNTTAMLKLVLDQIKGVWVPEDSPKYFKGFSVSYDDTLPHDTYIFTIVELV